MTPDVGKIEALLRDVVADHVLPRFRDLGDGDIERKPTPGDPKDIVTVVDRRVEAVLTQALGGLTPGVPVVGEELVYRRPGLLRRIDEPGPVWVLDPLDGTKNFARGDPAFGVMLAWVVDGVTRAAWLMLPVSGRSYAAEAGAGAYRDGERLGAPSPEPSPPRGTRHTRYMPPEGASLVRREVRRRAKLVRSTHCAAVEYAALVDGNVDFSVYYRLLPWDHAAGTLILTEAGGRAEHLDGTTYSPRSRNQTTIVARTPRVAETVRSWLTGASD